MFCFGVLQAILTMAMDIYTAMGYTATILITGGRDKTCLSSH